MPSTLRGKSELVRIELGVDYDPMLPTDMYAESSKSAMPSHTCYGTIDISKSGKRKSRAWNPQSNTAL